MDFILYFLSKNPRAKFSHEREDGAEFWGEKKNGCRILANHSISSMILDCCVGESKKKNTETKSVE